MKYRLLKFEKGQGIVKKGKIIMQGKNCNGFLEQIIKLGINLYDFDVQYNIEGLWFSFTI